MKKLFGNEWVKDTLVEILGSILTGVAIYNFAVPAAFPMTGFSGLALIVYRLFHLPIGAVTIVLNIPVAFLCYRLLGRQFFFRSVRCMILSSLFIDLAAPLLPQYTGSRLLAAICTRKFRHKPPLAALFPAIFNGLIVGLVVYFAYVRAPGDPVSVPTLLFNMATVALGELAVCYTLGLLLLQGPKKLSRSLWGAKE